MNEINGFSCIENHILTILQNYKNNILPLYFDSAISMNDLYNEFIIHGTRPEYFNLVQRVQDLLKELGIIDMKKYFVEDVSDLRREIRKNNENIFYLVRCKTDFATKKLYARGWREDHYVRVHAKDNMFTVINDIPNREISITAREFRQMYAGEYFVVKINRKLCRSDVCLLWEKRHYRAEKSIPFSYVTNAFDKYSDIGIRLRNLLIVYRIVRFREAEYYSMITDTSFICKQLSIVDRLLALVEYCNIKGTASVKTFELYFRELVTFDNTLTEELKKRILSPFG